MIELRDRVERGTYRVDPALVANTLIQKAAVVSRVRRRLESEGGHTPQRLEQAR
jgi:hypothetical protein